MTSEDGAHSGFQNVISKFTLHTLQKMNDLHNDQDDNKTEQHQSILPIGYK
jgi:hypothetical protein